MASNRWERLKHRRWQRNVGVLSIQRICVVTLLRVIGLQAAFENQFDAAIHPATVTGMVGVLEGLAHAASRQSIGVNAMLDEVIAHGIGTALRQTGVVLIATRPISPATDFDLLGLVTRIDDRKRLVQNAALSFGRFDLSNAKLMPRIAIVVAFVQSR